MTEDPFFACVLTESNDMEAMAAYYNLESAWAEWVAESCVERNGAHSWELLGEHPDDGSGVTLRCAHCRTGDASLGDLVEMANADLGGLRVIDGRHLSLLPFACPVTVDVGTSRWTSMDYVGYEYDAWLEIEPTGPVTSEWLTS